MITLPILEEFLREEGFVINAIDDLSRTSWQAVGIDLDYDTSGAVEIIKDPPGLYVWALDNNGPSRILAKVLLAHPQCFEQVLEALRKWNEHISGEGLIP